MGYPLPSSNNPQAQLQTHLSQQQTMPIPAVPLPGTPLPLPPAPVTKPARFLHTIEPSLKRIIAVVLVVAFALGIYFLWNSPAPSSTTPGITQQNFGSSAALSAKNSTVNTSTTNSGSIQVYIVGAVKNPGVYALPAGARVYQLLQAAGGPLPKANLVALNLAAPLTDGEEIYVTLQGEIPPSYVGGVSGTGNGSNSGSTTPGQLVNINTASVAEMRQALHISSSSAQNIVTYRQQHGPYTSVDQLLQVVSRSIYDKIKGLVTI